MQIRKFTKINHKNKGFTLVELLIVISLMSLFSSVTYASFTAAVSNTKVVQAKNDLSTVNIAMERFFEDYEDYPPIGDDHNSATILNPSSPPEWQYGSWEDVVSTLDNEHYVSKIPLLDPWGNSYGYDKNYKQPYNPAWSIICSAGPNKVLETPTGQTIDKVFGDDICIFFPDGD